MPKQITKQQHFAPRFYFKRFADGKNFLQVLDIWGGKLIKHQPYSAVCYADFFYSQETGKKDEMSQEFEGYFNSIEDYFSKYYDQIINDVLEYRHISNEQLEKLAWFLSSLWIRGPQMRENVNRMNEDMAKWMLKMTAAHPNFENLAKEAFEEYGKEATPKAVAEIRDFIENGEYNIKFDNISHLQFIADTEKFKNWFYAKSWRFYIAKGQRKFITSDIPVIEIFPEKKSIFGSHIMQRQHFFALTPEILIELVDPLKNKKRAKRQVVSDEEIHLYNLERARHSDKFCYSLDKKELVDLLGYYQGKDAIKLAVENRKNL